MIFKELEGIVTILNFYLFSLNQYEIVVSKIQQGIAPHGCKSDKLALRFKWPSSETGVLYEGAESEALNAPLSIA
jgi:hypothetical protein